MNRQEIEKIASVCHEVNRAICSAQGDVSQVPWIEAADWQRDSAIRGVEYRLANREASPEAQHEAWMKDKLADGWAYGPEKNLDAKTHPCLRPYAELPLGQRVKDYCFVAVVRAMAGES